MKLVYIFLVGSFLFATTFAAGLQFGAPWPLTYDWIATFGLCPAAFMTVVIFRFPAAIPSLVAFGCGIIMDTLLNGAIGYWTLTYTYSALIARVLSAWLSTLFSTRILGHAFTAFSVLILHIALNWSGLAYQSASIDIVLSVIRMFVLGTIVEMALTFFASLLPQCSRLGHMSRPIFKREM